MTEKSYTICFLPGRESSYSRNRVLLNAFRSANFVVHDCSCFQKNFFRYFQSFYKFLLLKKHCDFIYVGFLGHFLIFFVRLCTRKKIIFEVFISIYQTMALDQRSIAPNGLLGHFCRFVDRFSCKLANRIILDTHEHIHYFSQTFKLDKKDFTKIPVGSDETVFYPRPERSSDVFLVHFHGEFQPLHGVEYIIEAAKRLPQVTFRLIGHGREKSKCHKKVHDYKLNNVIFLPPIAYVDLPRYMSEATICLGIFGNTLKANMVIPHKVYEALAMKKPIITGDSPAIRELLTDSANALLCHQANPQSLAEKIMLLKDNPMLRSQIAEKGYEVYKKQCGSGILGSMLLNEINRLK